MTIKDIFKTFRDTLTVPHVRNIEPDLSKEDMKILRSFYDHYKTDYCKISYSQFFYTVYKMSIIHRIHWYKSAEILSKLINKIK